MPNSRMSTTPPTAKSPTAELPTIAAEHLPETAADPQRFRALLLAELGVQGSAAA